RNVIAEEAASLKAVDAPVRAHMNRKMAQVEDVAKLARAHEERCKATVAAGIHFDEMQVAPISSTLIGAGRPSCLDRANAIDQRSAIRKGWRLEQLRDR